MASEGAHSGLLSLPTEIRLEIAKYVFAQDDNVEFRRYDSIIPGRVGAYLKEDYSSSEAVQILLTCRLLRDELTVLAFRNTNFVVEDMSTPVQERLSILRPYHIQALRHISIVVESQEDFDEIVQWSKYPFDMESLQLDTLSIIFERSGQLHKPLDSNHELVKMLLRLHNVKKFRFIRNGAAFPYSFNAWFNTVFSRMLKEDYDQRYNLPGAPHLPSTWWDWWFDDLHQSFEFVVAEPMGIVKRSDYLEYLRLLVEDLDQDYVQGLFSDSGT